MKQLTVYFRKTFFKILKNVIFSKMHFWAVCSKLKCQKFYFSFIHKLCMPKFSYVIIQPTGNCSSSRLSSSFIFGYYNLFIFFQFILLLNEKGYQINLFRKWAASPKKASVTLRNTVQKRFYVLLFIQSGTSIY